ncbi:MAG: hypothetical protein RLY31_714 [Bacteroidota bacterium]|jgi:hypothetical protein
MNQNKITHWLVCLLFVLMQVPTLRGQCTLSCSNGDPASPGELSPGASCTAVVSVDTLVTISGGCTGPYLLLVRSLSGDTIAQGTGTVSAPVGAYLDEVVEIQVTDQPSGNQCNSYYRVVDRSAPAVLSCPNDTVSCIASLDPADISPVVVQDNCDGSVTTAYVDVAMAPNCGFAISDFIGAVVRQWTFTDDADNASSCTQFIYLDKPTAAMVTFPADVDLDCTASTAHPDSINSRPTLDGLPLFSLGFCNFDVQWSDAVSSGCGGNPSIMRTWSVRNLCDPAVVEEATQLIRFLDTTPPTIACPATLTVPTDPGECNADVTVPTPTVSDNCSPYWVTAVIGSFADLTDIPKGVHNLVYTATDSCFNSTTCTTVLTVQDTETPTAVCDEITIVSLPSNGTAVLNASHFDDGSSDNCALLTFRANRDGGTFATTVSFTCADVGDSIPVTLRVAEAGNPSSYNDCMNIVVVQDQLPPNLDCPGPLTIPCTADYSNLAVFGVPTGQDNCGYSLVETDSQVINNCGEGFILRTFTATDPSGNSTGCSQTITVDNSDPYDGSSIQWPEDYTALNACSAPSAFTPASLPSSPVNYSQPVLPSTDCAMLAVNFSDQLFFVSYPACYKIVRTWKVIDWCQYSPSNPSVGSWSHEQVIAIMDNVAPVITSCPPDTVVSVGLDCDLAVVNLPDVQATDCSPNLSFLNSSPFGSNNASGQYPAGVHVVTYTVKDGCGNKTTCSNTITVTDLLPPTPYCTAGVVAELQDMGGVIMSTIQPSHLNFDSFDNCTAPDDLVFRLRVVGDTLPPGATSLMVGCADIGIVPVELWVYDENGNGDYCFTDVIVQDNMMLCPPSNDSLTVIVTGAVQTDGGDMLPGVVISALNTPMSTGTNNGGYYQLNGLQQGGSYTIVPSKNDDLLNGVTTYDLVLLSRHVLGIAPLDSPYKLIAADINNSGHITTYDVVELRKAILQITAQFANNTSWRFVRQDYVFSDPNNPFQPAFPESLQLVNPNQHVQDANFIAVKIGDLNHSAAINLDGDGTEARHGAALYELDIPDRSVQPGVPVDIPLYARTEGDLSAIQFTLEFDTDDLEFSSMEEGYVMRDAQMFQGFSSPTPGQVNVSWYRSEPVRVSGATPLFILRFLPRRAGRLQEMLSVGSAGCQALAYDAAGIPASVRAVFFPDDGPAEEGFRLFENRPNPFRTTTTIRFHLPEAGPARIRVQDLNGRTLFLREEHYGAGYHELVLNRAELSAAGMLFCHLEAGHHRAVVRMVLTN